MDALMRLVRQGSRALFRAPAFTLSVILLLGLGVGSVSAIFAVVDHVLLRQLPYPAAERLFVVQNGSHSMPMYRDMQAMSSVEAWAAVTTEPANLTGEGEPLQLQQATITDGFFELFGARAAVGRLLTIHDYAAADNVVLSYSVWQRVFGGDAGVIGRSIRINDRPVTVVGVLDGNFAPPEALMDASAEIWTALDPAADYINNRNFWAFSVAGRLKPGAKLEDAERDAGGVATERAKAFPDIYTDAGVASPLPVQPLQEATIGNVRQGLGLLFGAVSLLLLVACANVTHLFLARGIMRVREMAVRRALGASTSALVAQLFIESVLLGAAGVAAGVLFAQIALRAFLTLLPEGLPRADAVHIDARVLFFAATIGVLTSLVFGLLPAIRFARSNPGNPLRLSSRNITGSRGAQTVRNGIVIMEVALSLVLVAQAGWLLRSFIRLTHQELGFRTENVVTLPLSVTGIDEPEEWVRRMDAIRASLAATPGVELAAFGMTMPLEWTGGGRCCWGNRPSFDGREMPAPSMFHPVSEDYFALLDLKMIAGRSWTAAQASAQPFPAVISEALAVQAFGDAASAVGRSFTSGKNAFEVIGVTADNRHYGIDQDYGTAVYLPANAIPFAPGRVHLALLVNASDDGLYERLRKAVWRVEPGLPVPTIRTLDEWSGVAAAQQRFESVLFVVFGVVTLLLVAGGLAGTLFYMVSLQRRDLGIRLALGATSRSLERVVLTRGVGMAALGVLLGTGAAWASGKLIESRLYGVDARDTRTLGLAVAVLMTIAFVSSWIPARRAAAVNPMESLRIE
jgi:putative ABC transport system permease protein